MAPACVRWHPQIHCCRGDIEGRSSGLESPQIDRHPVSPTAVLAATGRNLLKCGSTAVADTTRPVAASTAAINEKVGGQSCGQSHDCCD